MPAGKDTKRIRINKTATHPGGRPRKDLTDTNKDELYSKTPSVTSQIEDMLVDDKAKDLFKSAAAVLVHRQQLKPAHLTLLISYCNSFSISNMSPDELVDRGYVTKMEDGSYKPPIHQIFKTYNDSMIKAMQILRLDPKSELLNSLAKATEVKGSEYINTVKDVYSEM